MGVASSVVSELSGAFQKRRLAAVRLVACGAVYKTQARREEPITVDIPRQHGLKGLSGYVNLCMGVTPEAAQRRHA
jgi:hypothetical protein